MDFSLYGLSPKTEDAKWAAIRNMRNIKLAACDWTQLLDVELSSEDKITWANYRQSLRDITDNFSDPDDVEFPEVPNI